MLFVVDIVHENSSMNFEDYQLLFVIDDKVVVDHQDHVLLYQVLLIKYMYHLHHMLNLLNDNEFYQEFHVFFVKDLKIHLHD